MVAGSSCGQCGFENPLTAKFCNECGNRLASATTPGREERKVVSVLFVDVVGFTAASEGADVEEVRAAMTDFALRVKALCEAFGGVVSKYIGDAVMAVFGVPATREDDAERAVRAALAVRDAFATGTVRVRVGVNTGKVSAIVGEQSSDGMGSVLGDVVNTAARIQTAAEPGQIYVGPATHAATDKHIRYERAEAIAAKGKREPVDVWQAIEARSHVPEQFREQLRFVGRDRELQTLVDAFERSRNERVAQLVTVVGVPGIGKTRLVRAFAEHIETEPTLTRWREGRILPFGQGVALFAVEAIVKQECGIAATDNHEQITDKLDATLTSLGISAAERVLVRRQLLGLLGVASLIDSRPEESVFAWRLFVAALAADAPTVLVFDDLHWADDAICDFVAQLTTHAGDVPLFVVATARPELLERRPNWAAGTTKAIAIDLGPLSRADTVRLIDSVVDHTLFDPIVENDLLERVAGNPLFAIEYVRALVEGQGSVRELPDTVQGIISARIDRVADDEKRFLHAAAVLGADGWLSAIATLTDRDAAWTDATFRRLERKQFVRQSRRSRVPGDTEFTFTHALIHDVAYQQLTRRQRLDLHTRAAGWLTTHETFVEQTARNLAVAHDLAAELGEGSAERNAQTLDALAAAAHASAANHSDEATLYFTTKALGLDPPDAMRAELLDRHLTAQFHLDITMDPGLVEDALALVHGNIDAVLAAELLNRVAICAGDAGRMEQSLELLVQAVERAPQTAPRHDRYLASAILTAAHAADERLDRLLRKGYEMLAAAPDNAEHYFLASTCATIRIGQGTHDDLTPIRAVTDRALATFYAGAGVMATNLAWLALSGCADLVTADDYLTRGLAYAQRLGVPRQELYLIDNRFWVHFNHGDLDACRADYATMHEGEAASLAPSEVVSQQRALEILGAPVVAATAAATKPTDVEFLEMGLTCAALTALAAVLRKDTASGDCAVDDFTAVFPRLALPGQSGFNLAVVAVSMAILDRHDELARLVELQPLASPWKHAAQALAEERYTDAAAILDAIPSVPLVRCVREFLIDGDR